MLPDVNGLAGLDIGCGEGHNTHLLAERGASVTAIDIAGRFVGHARASASVSATALRVPSSFRSQTRRSTSRPHS